MVSKKQLPRGEDVLINLFDHVTSSYISRKMVFLPCLLVLTLSCVDFLQADTVS